MKAVSQDSLIQKYNLTLGTYYFYEQCIIAEIKKGVVIILDKLSDLIPLVIKYFDTGQPFTYISNRIHSHPIIPIDYLECSFINMTNFKRYGVITYNSVSEKSTEVEKHFAQRLFFYFKKLEDAIAWAKKRSN